MCAAHTAPAARARARRVHREVWHFDSALLSHRVFRAAQVPLAPAGLVCVVADGLWGRGDVRLVGVEGGRGCVCREERWRARDHDGIIRRRPRTLRSRAARGARGKMVAVNPIHFVMALGGGREGRAGRPGHERAGPRTPGRAVRRTDGTGRLKVWRTVPRQWGNNILVYG